jgi:hypothetical protein
MEQATHWEKKGQVQFRWLERQPRLGGLRDGNRDSVEGGGICVN